MKNVATNLALARSSDVARTPRAAALVAPTAVRPAVLFALFEQGCPTASLLRARALSRVLDAELHVMRVLPEFARVNALFPQNNVLDAVRTVERTLQANRSTREWLASCLGDDDAAVERFSIAHGNFVEHVAGQATELDAVLIIVPPCDWPMGHTVTSLAAAAAVPVLVAREATRDETIVAATDLESDGYPVLRLAAQLGQQLDAPVVALHNVNPVSCVGVAWPMIVLPAVPAVEARSARLSQVWANLSFGASAVIRDEFNPVDAILWEARKRDADLLVVGTRRRGWFDRLVTGSVAAQVVNRAKRSVLVTPLDDVGPLAVAPLARA